MPGFGSGATVVVLDVDVVVEDVVVEGEGVDVVVEGVVVVVEVVVVLVAVGVVPVVVDGEGTLAADRPAQAPASNRQPTSNRIGCARTAPR